MPFEGVLRRIFGTEHDRPKPAQISQEQHQELAAAQHRRNLLVEGIQPTIGEQRAAAEQMAVRRLDLSCQRDGLDAVTGKAQPGRPECQAFAQPKAF